jgi:hypothetical protein
MGDWFIRDFGEWLHTDEAKARREQLKRRGKINVMMNYTSIRKYVRR